MLRDIDVWFDTQPEPAKGCLLALRAHLLQYHPAITEAWKYKMPFYCYNGKMCCYLWMHKTFRQPYLGIVEGKNIAHRLLLPEKRARMKILLIDPEADIPMETVNEILGKMINWYGKQSK
ncbi:uncharacterized protein DUF1801 [Chitinophaga niastensis]|uniref:Uncharacterized protein DUF1801 n=1 Tax=Chitinophaga niastensis TaxID=536980 RepID=A0A2P8HDB5_CHINA|nr:DUF1801 domain-containing protein [Chitinophaga niastensis]PSL44217.1 uncharacterized protein DUF1801 [Chitinophaga niastensis]